MFKLPFRRSAIRHHVRKRRYHVEVRQKKGQDENTRESGTSCFIGLLFRRSSLLRVQPVYIGRFIVAKLNSQRKNCAEGFCSRDDPFHRHGKSSTIKLVPILARSLIIIAFKSSHTNSDVRDACSCCDDGRIVVMIEVTAAGVESGGQ